MRKYAILMGVYAAVAVALLASFYLPDIVVGYESVPYYQRQFGVEGEPITLGTWSWLVGSTLAIAGCVLAVRWVDKHIK